MVDMVDPVALAAAALLAEKALDGFAGEAGKRAWEGLEHLASWIRGRLRADEVGATALVQAEAQPDDRASLERLARVLQLHAAKDSDLRQRMYDLVERAKQNPTTAKFVMNLYDESKVGTVINAEEFKVNGNIDFKGFSQDPG
jgi:hypothetical protein